MERHYTIGVVLPRPHLLRLRRRSASRAMVLALGAMAVSLRLAGFPNTRSLHGTRWQLVTVPVVCWAMVETLRCLERRWSFYHAGILILLYSELMILAMVLFLWVYL